MANSTFNQGIGNYNNNNNYYIIIIFQRSTTKHETNLYTF